MKGFQWQEPSLAIAAAILICGVSIARSDGGGPYRFHSPAGRFDILVEPLADDILHVKPAQNGAQEAMKQYAIDLYPAKSSEPVNSIIYSDLNPPMTPEKLISTLVWSPNEEFVVLPDRQKARENNHVFQLAASLSANKVWSLEADHVHWVDNHRFVGDLHTKEIPGAVLEFDGPAGKAEILIQPDNGIGYEIAAVSGDRVTVKEFVNDRATGKTTWDVFTPACFVLDLDQLKKRSTACPPST